MALTSPRNRGRDIRLWGSAVWGKSTTQRLPTSGCFVATAAKPTVWGKDPLAWGPDYYQRIGVPFELPNHYQKLTGLENLRILRFVVRHGRDIRPHRATRRGGAC